ncbi:carboxypeptidase regulatory-like domain-containing protein [Pyxidicoccus sp. 3LFB2]
MRLHAALGLLLLLPAVALGAQVSGTVGDLKNQPFTGVSLEVVRADGGEVVARPPPDPEGDFTVELPPGRYVLRVRATDLCAIREEPLEVKATEDLAALAVQLRRCVRVTGRAFGEDGAPLVRGRVTLHGLWRPGQGMTAITDAAGRFELPQVPQDRFKVTLQDARGRQLLARVRLSAPRELEVRGERMLQVLVRGPSGKPLKNAEVLLVPEPREGKTMTTRTDARGLAGVPVQTRGRYRLLALWERQDTFSRYVWRDVELRPETADNRLELRFAERPSSASLSGRVRGPGNLPVAGVKVTAVQVFPSMPLGDAFLRNTAYPLEFATTLTDAEGRFTLKDLRDGDYLLEVEHGAGIGKSRARTGAPAKEVSLAPRCAKRATGRIVDEHGAPIRRFRLEEQHVTDDQGRFTHEGTCLPIIEEDGFLMRHVLVPASPSDEVSMPDIVLQRGRRLVGRLLLPDGTPAAKHTLTADWQGSTWTPGRQHTDASGRFTFDLVPANVTVVLEATSVEGQVLRHRVPASQSGDLALRLPPRSSRLDVRALTGEGVPLAGFHVTAENAEGSFSGDAQRPGALSLHLPPGAYEVRVEVAPSQQGPSAGVPLRFLPVSVQVPAHGTATAEARAMKGTGALRVLMPQGTHYDDVRLMSGVHPWPGNLHNLRTLKGMLAADKALDDVVYVGAEDVVSFRFRTVLTDFSELVPGRYTVFARDSYSGMGGRGMLFRKVVQVEGAKRHVVQVRFDGEDARELPWQDLTRAQ